MILTQQDIDLSFLPRQSQIHLLDLLEQFDKRLKYNKLEYFFPETGPYRRELYQKAMEVFSAGSVFKERVLCGANRSGKSTTIQTELAYHLTKLYPDWWEGHRFYEGIEAVTAGDSHQNVRDIAQFILLGNAMEIGTGLIPKDMIVDVKTKPGVPNAIADVWVRDKNGDINHCAFKSYEQGRKAFQGTTLHVVIFDEEPPCDVYEEGLTRTMTTQGLVLTGFTPLEGLTPLVLEFLPGGMFPRNHVVPGTNRWIGQMTWEDAPHLSEIDKKRLEAGYLPHMKEARMLGIPTVGAGRIYPVPEANFVINPFDIPSHWPRFYAMDVGFKCTAAIFFAYDPDVDCLYCYDEYYGKEVLPESAAAAIRRKGGTWIPGVVDPSAMKGNERDGSKLRNIYRELGLELSLAKNAVELGIQTVLTRLSTARLKVMVNCQNLLAEYRVYRYNDKGEVARNQSDHAMDAWKYGVLSGIRIAMSLNDFDNIEREAKRDKRFDSYKDTGRNPITGY